MKLSFKLKSAFRLEHVIIAFVLLLIFKILFPVADSFILLIINELLTFGGIYFLFNYLRAFIHPRTEAPLSIILNTGILGALLFFIISISRSVFDSGVEFPDQPGFITAILLTIVSAMLLIAAVYIFAAIRELFSYRQKRNPRSYFNTMLTFFILASVSVVPLRYDNSLSYLYNTFFAVAIILIVINSLRVGWIAFLAKKQKIQLLVISIVLSGIFITNFVLSLHETTVNELFSIFSPSFAIFLNLMMIYGGIYFGVIFFTALFHLPTAEAFDRKAEEASSLMDLSKLMTRVLDFKELAETITFITMKVCFSDSAWLVTKKDGNYELSSVMNIGYVEADEFSKKLELEHFEKLDKVTILNQRAVKIKVKNDIRKINFRSIAVAPLKVQDKVNGYLFAGKKESYDFDEDEKKAIEAYADYAAIALENARHIEESIEKERLEKELDVAREIQYKILPNKTPSYPRLDISALFIPAFEVGGDYYDFFELGEDNLGFVIADVSGKGISAAFVMAEVKGVFESLARLIFSPKELLIKANEILIESLDIKTFVTAIYGIINYKTGKLTFSRVGHNPAYLVHGNKIEKITPPGIGLGIDKGSRFSSIITEKELYLSDNDIFMLYTDGIPESQNAELEDFGYERMEKILLKNKERDLIDLSNAIMKEVTIFSKDNSQHDDITLVLFKRVIENKELETV